MKQNASIHGIEQLWYTWSATGLGELKQGFRVRAVSSGLTDLYGGRMNQLRRYLDYSLPSGADEVNTPRFDPQNRRLQGDAPICLAFIRTGSGERALVYKVYTGKDEDGRDKRPGAYFAHMLANLPIDFFSARDAIKFWCSPFWQTADLPASKQGTDLSSVSLTLEDYSPVEICYQDSMQLRRSVYRQGAEMPFISLMEKKQRIPEIHFNGIEALEKDFYEHLSFVLRAYLLRLKNNEEREREKKKISNDIEKFRQDIEVRRKSWGELKRLKLELEEKEALLELMRRRESPRIFIAAPPDEVAFLIAGLTRLLPRHFLKNMTFSTYESDVLTKLPLDIVGTCPPPVLLDPGSTGRDILPPACYQKGFVLNTYQGASPQLDEIRVPGAVPDVDYAEHYADFAVEKLQNLAQDSLAELELFFKDDLDDLPEKGINELPELSVHKFLYRYYLDIVRKQLSLTEISRILNDPATAVEALRKFAFRKQIFVRAYRDTAQSSKDVGYERETREEHLAWLQNDLPFLLRNLRNWCKSPSGPASARAPELNMQLDELAREAATEVYKASTQDDLERFLAILAPLRALEPGMGLWIDLLLTRCYNDPQSLDFIKKYWVVREILLGIAIEVLEPGHPISLFLLDVAPVLFGRLLAVLRATAWKSQATLLFLQKGHISSPCAISGALLYDKQTIQALEHDFIQVKVLVTQLLKSPPGMYTQPPYAQWRATAWDLFLALVNSGYKHQSRYQDQCKMALLVLWFEDANGRDALSDLPLDRVLLSAAERQILLGIVIEILEPAHLISLFLLGVEPVLFGQLLRFLDGVEPALFGRLRVPQQGNVRQVAEWNYEKVVTWKHQATLVFLQKGQTSRRSTISGALLYDKETIQALENDFIQVKALVAQLLKSPRGMRAFPPYEQWRKTALHLFLALVNSGCKREYLMILLPLWFDNADEHNDLPDIPLDPLLLNPEDIGMLLENYGPALLQRNNGWHVVAPLFWRMVEAEEGASRNIKVMFILLDKHINRQSFLGLLDAEKFGKYFNAAETHLLLQRYSTQYTTEFHILLMQREHMDDIGELLVNYSNYHTKEVHDLLIQHSVEYMGKVHDLLIQYSDHYTEEGHGLLTRRNPSQYRSEVHGLLMQCSNHYTEEVHDLLIQRYPDQYTGEADELFIQRYSIMYTKEVYDLFMRYFPQYREAVRGLLERYSDRFIREVHELLWQESKQYNSIFRVFWGNYCKNHKNILKGHICLLQYSEPYRKELHKLFKERYPEQSGTEYAQTSAQSLSPNYYSQQRGEDLPQYLHDYSDVPLWTTMVTLLQQANHPGKMPLVNAAIQAGLQYKETAKMRFTNGEPLDHFLGTASLSNSDLYDVMYRFGPAMLDIRELSDVVLKYYCARDASKDLSLLCTLLDKHPEDDIANKLLEATSLDDTEISWYFSRYWSSHPSFCYGLLAARALLEKLGWPKVQQYLPAWLHNGMSEPELQDVLGRVPLETFNSSWPEVYGQRYLAAYPKSSVLLKLSRQYLQVSGASIFQRERGRRFLHFLYNHERKNLPASFADLGEIIDDRYKMLQFIEQPVLMQDQLFTVFGIILNNVPSDSDGGKSSWIEPLARALITCIDYRGDLGIALSSISMVNANYTAPCLFDMAKRVKVQISASDDEVWWRRNAILLECALLPDLLPVNDPHEMITGLLPNTNTTLRPYINRQAMSWSPDAQDAAREYGLKPSQPVSPKSDSPISPPLSATEPIPTPVIGRQLVKTQVKVKFPMNIVKSVQTWLFFPWLFCHLWWFCRQRGTGRLARLWFDYREMLIASGDLVPDVWKQHIRFACAFHNACQEASEESALVEADRRVLAVIEMEEYKKYLPKLTSHEKLRVRLAAERIGIPAPAYLSSLERARKTWQDTMKTFLGRIKRDKVGNE